MLYVNYNREERALCSHLFRLLHEGLSSGTKNCALYEFLRCLNNKSPILKGEGKDQIDLEDTDLSKAEIFTEVALIRDAYYARKPDVLEFMNQLTKIVMMQENISDCRLYSELPEELNNQNKTHPKQIRAKAERLGVQLSTGERQVYGAIQAIFNAKPDLAIIIDGVIVVFEIKFTEPFDNEQLRRTWNIAEIWASNILCQDIGFSKPPSYTVAKLGRSGNVHVSWEDVLLIARGYFDSNDKSIIAFNNAVSLLNTRKRSNRLEN